ncbi:NAD(P)H-quinone oxidoreductase [Falsarthrobacter nasiphocae]|uniref:NADPH2:quinone reductase n=1 Tax=Falsarthrobacter nasiphocae TaxID=189863 RepID=A0AAE3YDD2_9MICC|nr:NAD(P)H-quinone oxidoreductase [Falsarthrobacter nasiphocae]MDR6891783.1 NADPH2:quinone reductase [Falsarthrobacter nasiphocae]
MRAVIASEPGGPEVLRVVERPEPSPAEGQLLIETTAAGVNRADVQQRLGVYPPPPGETDVLGLEVSGRVVGGDRDGEQVVALLASGGYAERVAVDAGLVLPVPAGIDPVDAAGLPEVAATVHSNLGLEAGLRSGETVLIHGGAGGIGSFAIQYAAALGARVITTAGGPEKADYCRELGADVVVDHRSEDFVERVKEEAGGADVVLDVVGAAYLPRNLAALATGGRVVVIGLQKGRTGELDLATLMGKRARIIGTTLRSRPLEEKRTIMAGVRERVWPLIESGAIRVTTDRVFPLDEAAAAHARLDEGVHRGKVLLRA